MTVKSIEEIAYLFELGLEHVRDDVLAYPDEAKMWSVTAGIQNSAGNLCLHIAGNLQHFVGAQMGESGYVRDREAEFGDKDVSRVALLQIVDETRLAIAQTLSEMKEADLERKFENPVFDEPATARQFLMHLLGHLWYHAGQINYHRRLIAHQ